MMKSSISSTQKLIVISPQKKWSDLPTDVLLFILKYLDLKTDLPRLRGVCHSWRSPLPDPNESPLVSAIQVPSPAIVSNKFLILVRSTFNLLSPLPSRCKASEDDSIASIPATPTRWLVRMIEVEPKKWHLLNPLNIQDLFLAIPPVTGTISLFDCRVSELAASYSLVDGGSGEDAKVVSEKVVALSDYGENSHFIVLALLEGGLVIWRMGDEEWTQIEASNHKFLDIASHHGKFYASDMNFRKILVIDPKNYSETKSLAIKFINVPALLDENLDNENVYGLYLVAAANGCLYLVFWVHEPSDNMVVFVLKEDEEQENWEQVMSLGDQILFIGTDVSFSLPSSSENLPQWKSSSICLFMKPAPLIFGGYVEGNMPEGTEGLKLINYAEYFRYFMIFDLEKEGGCVEPFEELSKQVYTGVFFPPPAWVKWHCPDLGNIELRLDHLKYHDYIDDDYEEPDEADYHNEDYGRESESLPDDYELLLPGDYEFL